MSGTAGGEIESELVEMTVAVRIRYSTPEGRTEAIAMAGRELWIDCSSTAHGGISAKVERGPKRTTERGRG